MINYGLFRNHSWITSDQCFKHVTFCSTIESLLWFITCQQWGGTVIKISSAREQVPVPSCWGRERSAVRTGVTTSKKVRAEDAGVFVVAVFKTKQETTKQNRTRQYLWSSCPVFQMRLCQGFSFKSQFLVIRRLWKYMLLPIRQDSDYVPKSSWKDWFKPSTKALTCRMVVEFD